MGAVDLSPDLDRLVIPEDFVWELNKAMRRARRAVTTYSQGSPQPMEGAAAEQG
jgi:hypothetical protein